MLTEAITRGFLEELIKEASTKAERKPSKLETAVTYPMAMLTGMWAGSHALKTPIHAISDMLAARGKPVPLSLTKSLPYLGGAGVGLGALANYYNTRRTRMIGTT